MFGFIKKKLSDAVNKFAKKAAEPEDSEVAVDAVKEYEEHMSSSPATEDTASESSASEDRQPVAEEKTGIDHSHPITSSVNIGSKSDGEPESMPEPLNEPEKEVLSSVSQSSPAHEDDAKVPGGFADVKISEPAPETPEIHEKSVSVADKEPELSEEPRKPESNIKIQSDESSVSHKPVHDASDKISVGDKKASSVSVSAPVPESESKTEVSGTASIPATSVTSDTSATIVQDHEPKQTPVGAIESDDVKIDTNIEEKPKGFFGRIKQRISTVSISDDKFESLFENLELALLESSVAVEVIDKIKDDLRSELTNRPISRSAIDGIVQRSLAKSISSLFVKGFDVLERVKTRKDKTRPFVIMFVGINGSGKTTSIAKMAHLLKKNNLPPVLAAADTFRAAAIAQLEEHGNRLGLKVIKHDYGSDPAAVAFDAIRYAEASSEDVVLVDTAGRLHNNQNLIDEMKKIIRVSKPDIILFVGESITGNDCVEQARQFNEAADIDGIILSKADIDEKGGASVSVSYVTGKPILYIGTGQDYDDLKAFNQDVVLASLGLSV